MKLKSITIENFRCFDHFTLTLHPQLTVLVAPNGVGKTTLLDTLRIATWPFVKAFDLASQTGKSATIQIDDVRRVPNEQGDVEWRIPAQVSVTGDWSQNHLDQTWWQSRDKIKPRTHPRYSDIKHSPESFAKSLQEKIFQQQSTTIELPLIAYLGTGRLWYQGRHDKVADSKLDKSAFSRTWGYKECLSAISSYKQFEQWFSWVYISFREQQLEALESGATFDEQGNTFKQSIDVVKKAVNALTQEATGWGDIAYLSSAQQQIVLKHPQH
ncbi:MAG: AAA family ATPase, partial [Algicola sp.]|nr:AAA family ATPase [Algicola sp.]